VKLVFLAGARASGTEFVHSLLDGHPRVLAVPFPMMFHYFWRLHGEVAEQGAEALFDALCEKSGLAMVLRNYQEPGNPYMEKDCRTAERLEIDLGRLREHFIEQLGDSPISRRDAFLAFYRGYAEAVGHPWKEVVVILENAHNTFYHREVLEDFPEACFISPVRDPHAIFASCRKGRFGDVYEGLAEASMLMHLYQTFINQWIYSRLLGAARYYLIKNEAIHKDKRACMEELAEWCGIEFDESMMRSTFANSPWEGNSAYRKGNDTGVFQARSDEQPRWMGELSLAEIRLVEVLFGEFIHLNGYGFYALGAREPSFNDLLTLLRPVKNQVKLSGLRWGLGKNQWVKNAEFLCFPLFRMLLRLFYYRMLERYLLIEDPMAIDPNQDVIPKLRLLFGRRRHRGRTGRG